jgi:DNA-binding CsgD family transcriptional regulator
VGGSIELADSGVPFAPFVEVLRGLPGSVPDADLGTLLGPGRRDLDRLVHEADGPGRSAEATGLAWGSSQGRLFETFLALLRRLATGRPCLLVIEDIHWADRSTLELLLYLARNVRDAGIVMVATYRSDELHRRHPLLPFLAELERGKRTERLELARFTRAETADQVRAIRGPATHAAEIERVFARSEGNAFYAEELLAAEGEGEGAEDLPGALRDVLIARVAMLGEPTEELLGVVAAGGAHVPASLLAAVADLDEVELDRRLREAVERHILVAEGEGHERFAFRHALVREAVYQELLPGERTRLHTRFAQHIERAGSTDRLPGAALLAYHWYAAHDVPRAVETSVRAAAASEAVYAFSDAHALYERVLELWERVPDAAARVGFDRVELFERAARAAAANSAPRAVALIREALKSVDANVDPVRAGMLQDRLGRYSWLAGDALTALEACREAVRLVPAQPPTLERARVTAGLGQILMVEAFGRESLPICEEAIAAARAVGAREIEGHALNSLGYDLLLIGDADRGLAYLHDAREIADELGSVDDVDRADGNIADAMNATGRFADAAAMAADAIAWTEERGASMFGAFVVCEGIYGLFRLGRWQEASELLDRASVLEAPGVAEIFMNERRVLLEVARGQHAEARDRLELLARLSRRVVVLQWTAPLAEARAELALLEGRPQDARTEIREVLRRAGASAAQPGMIGRVGPLYALGMRAEADIAQRPRSRRSRDRDEQGGAAADGLIHDLRRIHGEIVAGAPAFRLLGDAFLSLVEAENERRVGRSEPTGWTRAAAACAAVPYPYWQAYALWRQGETLLSLGKRAGARQPLAEALEIASRLGAEPLRRQIGGLALRARLDARRSTEGAAEDAGASYGLTPREREVLGLLAGGRTNRQIAEQLFITEKTASVHVSNILGKLAVGSRTEAASLALRLGLVAATVDSGVGSSMGAMGD